MSRKRIVTIAGTRPEVIKLAPVVHELERRDDKFEHLLVTTAQHREMLDQVLAVFRLKPSIDLGLMHRNQSLASFASRSLVALNDLFARLDPDTILVQGDTTTTMTAALAAFYLRVPVGHVEAGLRSFDKRNPFPEEVNRRVAGCLVDLHFAPTDRARNNLIREGVEESRVFVTGNTIVDALKSVSIEGEYADDRTRLLSREAEIITRIDHGSRKMLLVTAHRRENHGAPLRSICRALAKLAATGDVEIVYPVHMNPNVSEVVHAELGAVPGVTLLDPVSYVDLLRLMKRSYLILTDSGGIQEEAPSFNKPVLVLREATERPELIEAGAGKLVGTDADRIHEETTLLLNDEAAYTAMTGMPNPFGDGRAAERIVDILAT